MTSLSCPSSPAAAVRRPSPPTCGTTNPQRRTTSISWGRRAGICGAAGDDHRLRAITNVASHIDPPWKTWDKDTGTLKLIAPQQFYQGAINVSAFGLDPCISTLVTNTRSSAVTTRRCTTSHGCLQRLRVQEGDEVPRPERQRHREYGEPGLSGSGRSTSTGTPARRARYDGEPVFTTKVTDENGAYCSTASSPATSSSASTGRRRLEQVGADIRPPGETLVTNCQATRTARPSRWPRRRQTGNDFGNYQPASKSGTKFVDTDGDGVRDDWRTGPRRGWRSTSAGPTTPATPFHEHNHDRSPTAGYSFHGHPPGDLPRSARRSPPATRRATRPARPPVRLPAAIRTADAAGRSRWPPVTRTRATTSAISRRRPSAAPSSSTWMPTACAMPGAGADGVEINLVGTDSRATRCTCTAITARRQYSFRAPRAATRQREVPAG